MSEKDIPYECPLIDGCIEHVSEETFENVCDCAEWIICERAKDLAKRMGFLKKPREWAKESEEEK